MAIPGLKLSDLKTETQVDQPTQKTTFSLSDLKQGVETKEPSYFQRVKESFVPSAIQYGKDIVQPFLNPIQTAKDLGTLGKGIYELATPGEQPEEKVAKAVGQYFVDRYGSLEAVKESFAKDPVGVLGDASLILTGGTALAAKTAGKTSKLTKALEIAADYTDPIVGGVKTTSKVGSAVASAVSPKLSKIPSQVASMTTGVSPLAYETAYQAGKAGGEQQKAFVDALKGMTEPDKVVTDTINALKEVSKTTKQTYKIGKQELKLETKPIDFKPISESVVDFELGRTFEGQLDLSDIGQSKLKRVKEIIGEWEKNPKLHNAKGLDQLKRRIDNEYPPGIKPGDDAVVVTEIRNKIKDAIIKQVPEYADVMKIYEEAINLERQMMKELSVNNKSNAGTILRKLQSLMKQNGDVNFGNRLNIIKNLEEVEGVTILPQLSGFALQQYLPSGLQKGLSGTVALGAGITGNLPTYAMTLPFQSPRIMGSGFNIAGQMAKKMGDIGESSVLQKYGPMILRTPTRVSRPMGLLQTQVQEEQNRQGLLGGQ
jgi:hypothetical protein